jgi:TPR repeat protein
MKKPLVMITMLVNSICAFAQESEWNKAFNIIWESRWQQNGVLLPAARWPSDSKSIKFSINKAASSSNANRAREALKIITQVLAWQAIEVEEGHPDTQIEFTIRQYQVDELRQFVCHARPSFKDGYYTKMQVMLSEQYAYQCVLHELMHAFGFPGHPQGETVLSYFEGNRSRLKPMDEFLLQAWYSDRIKVNTLPFTTIHELTQIWIEKTVATDLQEQAWKAQQNWYRDMLKRMEDFALNNGEPPTILYRSGLISADGIRFGRANIQGMLGVANLFGLTVNKDISKAARLLLLGAQNGNDGAARILANQLKVSTWQSDDAKPICLWLHATPSVTTKITNADQLSALDSKACKQALAP